MPGSQSQQGATKMPVKMQDVFCSPAVVCRELLPLTRILELSVVNLISLNTFLHFYMEPTDTTVERRVSERGVSM